MQQIQLGEQADLVPESQHGGEPLTCTDEDAKQRNREKEHESVQDNSEQEGETVSASTFWSRLRKLFFVLAVIWLAVAVLRGLNTPRSSVIYASRYSEDHKFRPAASPVITERLKDGRTRIRGADPTARPVPSTKPKPKARKRRSNKRKRSTSRR